MTSYLTSSKMPFTDKDGHLTKAFQQEKHDTASHLLKEYPNRNWNGRWLNLFWNKTAELSQKRPRDAPNTWVPWKVSRVLTTHPATFPQICNGLLFRSILRMCVQNLKFVALPVAEIIGGTQTIWAVPVYAHAPFSPKFLIGFCAHGPTE